MFWIMMTLTLIALIMFPTAKWLYLHKFYNESFYIKWNNLNNKYKITRITTIVVAIIVIALYIGVRWAPILVDTIKGGWFYKAPSEIRSSNISIILCLDICSLLSLLMPALAIFNKWEFIKSLAPIAIIGAILTIFVSCYLIYDGQTDPILFFLNTYKVGLIQSQLGPLVFWMHLWIFGYSISAFTWHGSYTAKNWLYLFIFIAVYVSYICAIAYSIGIMSHTTACAIGDYQYLDNSYYEGVPESDRFVTYIAFNDVYPVGNWKILAPLTWMSFLILISAIVVIVNFIYWIFNRNRMIIIDMIHER